MTNRPFGVAAHTADCAWHFDQYDFECTCGASACDTDGPGGQTNKSPPQSADAARHQPQAASAGPLIVSVANAIQQVVMLTRAEAMDAARAAIFVVEKSK